MKTIYEKIMYWVRPLAFCKGQDCYVMTPGRKNGEPYCNACKGENKPLIKE